MTSQKQNEPFEWLDKQGTKLLLFTFVVSRLLYFLLGVRFTADIPGTWQLLDSELLRTRLLESVFYCHAQPPLMNVITGVALKLSPCHPELLLWPLFLGFGLLMSLSILHLMKLFGASERVSRWSVAVFIVLPPTIMYENWYFSTYPTASLLAVTMLALGLYQRSGHAKYAFLTMTAASSLALLRPSFHLLWVVALLAYVLHAKPILAWKPKVLATVPVLVVVLWYAKNLVIFGTFASSSWMGMNLYRVANTNFPSDMKTQMLSDGRLRMRQYPNRPVEEYGAYSVNGDMEAIPVLYQMHKAGGETNMNHYAYIEMSNRFLQDSKVMIRTNPGSYLRAVGEALHVFLRSNFAYAWLPKENVRAVSKIGTLYDNVVCGRFVSRFVLGRTWWGNNTYPVLALWLLVVIAMSLSTVVYWMRSRDSQYGMMIPAILTVLFLSLTYILFEIDENNRFRFEVDPLIWVIGIALISRTIQHAVRGKTEEPRVEPRSDG